MIRPSRAARLAAVAAAATLVLASCAQDDSSNNNAEESPAAGGESSAPAAKKGDGTMTVGALLPQTGDLAYLGPPQFAGVQLAIEDINAAGGVLGKDVVQHKADEGDGTPDVASGSTDKLLDAGVDVIIGAAASTVTLSVIDKITGAGVVEFSGSNTSAALDTYNDKGLYFRTAPSDNLQGAVLANLTIKDGYENVAILARQDSYGEGLAKQVQATIEEQGGEVATNTLYAADATNYTADINKVAATKPDALVLIGFEETKKIIPGLVAKKIGPQDLQLYLVDGNTVDYSKDFDPGLLEGAKGTIPTSPEIGGDFKSRLDEVNPKLKDYTYGPQVYDATVMAALAATAAGDDAGEAIASKIVEISKDGTKCSEYSKCVDLLDKGEDIDYEGVSGPVDLNDNGSVNKATIGINLYGKDNTFKQVDSVSGVLN